MKEDFRALLEQLRDPAATSRLLLIERKARRGGEGFDYTFYRAEFFAEDQGEFIDAVALQLSKIVTDDGVQFAEYELEDMTDEYVQFLDFEHVPNYSDFQNAIARNAAVPTLPELNKPLLGRLWAYAVRIELPNGKVVTYFVKYSRSKMTMKGTRTFFNESGQLRKIEKDLFVFDGRVDCVVVDGTLWILHRKNFELIFSYNEAILQAAGALLNSLESTNLIENIAEFKGFIQGDLRYVRKLASANTDALKSMDYNYIREVIETYELSGIAGDEQTQKFSISDKPSAMVFFRVLNEEYYTTQVSREKRVVLANRPLR